MLAVMPQPPRPPLSDTPPSASVGTSTMSLAILPSSPMAYNGSSIPTLRLPLPSPAKKPRLTLNTNNLCTAFGKKATSLRLETLSATSPTSRNTFTNGHNDLPAMSIPRPRKPTLTPLRTSHEQHRPSTPERSASSESIESESSSTVESASSFSTVGSFHGEAPYTLAYNIKSILSNGPVRPYRTRKSAFAQSKPMFPVAKKVTFKAPLEEEVTTTVYVMRHSDIESSSSTISTLELSPPKRIAKRAFEVDEEEPVESEPSKDTEERREASSEAGEHDSCPATPVAGRNKKDRQWVWTLGPLDSQKPPESDLGDDLQKGN